MALDFFHAVVYDDKSVASIRKNISFIRYGDLDLLEEIYPFKKEIDGLILKVIKDSNNRLYIDISGSLHKFYNYTEYNKSQNFDDFTFTLQSVALDRLSKKIGCDLCDILIISFEFGVNINCGVPANNLIEKIHYFDRIKVPIREVFGNSGLQKKFKTDSYSLKIYNKSQEAELFNKYGLYAVNDLIRLEFKSRDKHYTNSQGIYTLENFKDPKIVKELFTTLKKKWAKIYMLNSTIEPCNISKANKVWFERCVRLNYFNGANKENFKNTSTRNNHYNKCIEILDKYHYRTEYDELSKLIEYKSNFLMSAENGLIEIVMDTVYRELLKAPKITQTALKGTIGVLTSISQDEKILHLLNQATERLQRAGHIDIIQGDPISYRVI